MNDPEIFLFHILIKMMGKNKASKTTEENSRLILEEILRKVPTTLGSVKYRRHKSVGSQTQRFNSSVIAKLPDEHERMKQ
jgi:hypothetical protein